MANKEQLEILKQGVDVWNQWRQDHPNIKIDLSGADLVAADLNGADLRAANLSRADLRRADLGRADLRNAILWGVNFTRADLRQANLMDSVMGHAFFGDCDLGSSRGLEKIHHWTSSTVGTDAISKSKGRIPIRFLRGCGLSDVEIEFAKLAAPGLDTDQVTQIVYEIHRLYCNQPIQFYSCFISYNSRDQAFAQRLHDDLQNNGVRCWFAPEDMKIGDELRKAVGKEIRVRDKLLIILSENSIRSEWVGDEVEKALAEEREQGALKLFPIRLDDAVFETKDDWAEKIRLRRHIGDFSSDYDKAFQKLLRDLKPQ
ncbi:MAG: toll/interleukin-1 receptor domain-containing protein [Anaerolineales bacterium]